MICKLSLCHWSAKIDLGWLHHRVSESFRLSRGADSPSQSSGREGMRDAGGYLL